MEDTITKEIPIVKEDAEIGVAENGKESNDVKMIEESVVSEATPVTEEIKKKILKQMEYYFGNYNLPRDKFLNEESKKDEGWIQMSTMLNFKRLVSLSDNADTILNAIESSELIEIDESRLKIRRSIKKPLPESAGDLKAESLIRTVYVKGFPKDGSVNLDVLLEYFKEHGPVETIFLRNFHDQTKKISGFKGSILVTFPTRELAETFLKKFDLKYKNTPLLRMWYEDYQEEKTKEYEEILKRKEEKIGILQSEKEELENNKLPKGAYLHMSNIPIGTTKQEIKEALIEYTTDFAFIGLGREKEEGYIRFKTEGCNVHLLSQLQDKLKIKENVIKFRLVEGEEETEQLKLTAEAFLNSRSQHHQNKRRGSYGGRGHQHKRRRCK